MQSRHLPMSFSDRGGRYDWIFVLVSALMLDVRSRLLETKPTASRGYESAA
jgi:hypothetical protein